MSLRSGMSGAGLLVVGSVCVGALEAVTATAWRFTVTGELDATAVAWSTGLVGTAAALLARTYSTGSDETPVPVTTAPGDSVDVEPAGRSWQESAP